MLNPFLVGHFLDAIHTPELLPPCTLCGASKGSGLAWPLPRPIGHGECGVSERLCNLQCQKKNQ